MASNDLSIAVLCNCIIIVADISGEENTTQVKANPAADMTVVFRVYCVHRLNLCLKNENEMCS